MRPQVWPQIAAWFGLKAGPPQPMSLAKMMADKEPMWKELQKKYSLSQDATWSAMFAWDFGDGCFQMPFDAFCNTNKLKQAGFNEQKIDTPTMFIAKLNELASKKFIPRYTNTPTPPSLLKLSAQAG